MKNAREFPGSVLLLVVASHLPVEGQGLNGRTSLKQRFADSTVPMMQPIKTSKIFRSLIILFTAWRLETCSLELGAGRRMMIGGSLHGENV